MSPKDSQNVNKSKKISQNKIEVEEVSQSEIKSQDLSQCKMASLSLMSTSRTKALSGVPYVKKRKLRTFRPGVARIFKHLSPECQQNYDDWCFCREYTLVGKSGGKTGGSACTRTLGDANLYSVWKPGLAQFQKGREWGESTPVPTDSLIIKTAMIESLFKTKFLK